MGRADDIAFTVIITACVVSPLLWIFFGARTARLGIRAVVQILSATAFLPWYGIFLTIFPAFALWHSRPKLKIGRVIFVIATLFLVGMPFFLGAALLMSHNDGMVHGRNAIAGAIFVWAIIQVISQYCYMIWMLVLYGRLNDTESSTNWILVSGFMPMAFGAELLALRPNAIVAGITWSVLLAILLVGSRCLAKSSPTEPQRVLAPSPAELRMRPNDQTQS